MIINQEPQPEDQVSIDKLCDAVPPELLYAKDVVRGTSFFHRVIRDLLLIKGVPYEQPENRRINKVVIP